MRKRMLVSFLGLIYGCPAPEEPEDTSNPSDPPTIQPPTTPWQPSVVEVGDADANVESVSIDAASGAVPLEPADVLALQGDEVRLYDPLAVSEVIAYDIAPVRSAAWWDDALLIATDDGLVTWNGGLVPNSLDDMVEGVTDLLALKSGLWLDTADGLVVLRDDQLSAVTVGGVAAHRFARGTAGTAPVVWTYADDQVVAVNFTDAGLVPFESFTMFGAVEDVAATNSGRVLAVVEGWLVERQAANNWVRLDIGEPARELRGRRGAESIWVRTDTQWIHVAESFDATNVPVAIDARADAFGRLVASSDAGIERYAVGYPLLLLDVPTSNVLTDTPIRVVPTAADLEPTLTVTATSVGGAVETLAVDDFTVVLDPDVLTPGPWTIDATAEYTDDTATASATVVMGADFEPTWNDHIQPIYETQCTPCHDGSQGIIDLQTEAAWVQYMLEGSTPTSAGILERVTIDNMPSDTRVLSAQEKYLVEAWRDVVLP